MKNIIGILGGMGPAATADMFQKFIQLTPAHCDQEHIPLVISSIPDIPDRTTSILHEGESPLPAMEEYMHGLERAGAKCIIIACNTAHYWYNDLKKKCNVDMLNIIDFQFFVHFVANFRDFDEGFPTFFLNCFLHISIHHQHIE